MITINKDFVGAPKTPLCDLGEKYNTDKFYRHYYTPVYFSLFNGRQNKVKRVLELGIKNGASLRMWEEFFPNAEIFGLDNRRRCLLNEGRIKSFLGNEEDPKSLVEIVKSATKGALLDFIIDDASHRANFQLSSAIALLPFLTKDGVYVIEDIKLYHGLDDPTDLMGTVSATHTRQFLKTNRNDQSSTMIVIRPC